jgi:Sulfotransferase family
VDKLLSPNPVYWEKWGIPAIRKLRKTREKTESSCGSDITFQEYVQHVTEELWIDESHVMPIAMMCDPCRFNYTVIGKLETFSRDAGLVLAYLGVNESQVGFERMATDALSDAVSNALGKDWLKLTLKCVSRVEVAKRIWRKLQLRWLISWKMNFELSTQDVANLRPGEFITILERAATDCADYGDMGFQKKQATLEAFKRLKPWQFKEIERIFKPDFLLFGYNFIQFVDKVQHVQTTGALDWSKDWDLSALVSSFE